jgi:predicted histone-like DNA-binding protein
MSVIYKLVQRQNPQDRSKPGKFYAQAVTIKKIGTEELCQEIADSSTVSATDVYATLMELKRLIPRKIAGGNAVEIEGLFDIRPMIHGSGADTEEDYNVAENVDYIRALVLPKKNLREAVRKAGVEKAPWLRENASDEDAQGQAGTEAGKNKNE